MVPPKRGRAAAPMFVILATAAGIALSSEAETRRLGAVSFYNPRLMVIKYQPLVDYLSEATDAQWELAISTSYEETVERLCDGSLDLAYLGPFTYVRAHARCGATPVVRLQTGGSASYRSQILVRDDSSFEDLTQLAGRRFGFGAPLSTSSHLVPRAMLTNVGVELEELDCRFYGHHERAARAVLLGEVDACGVRDVVGERFRDRGLRLLARSEPIPNFPLVVRPEASRELIASILHALVEIPAESPAVRRRMAGWDEELAGGFAPASDREYAPVRRLVERIFGPAGLKGSEAELEPHLSCQRCPLDDHAPGADPGSGDADPLGPFSSRAHRQP